MAKYGPCLSKSGGNATVDLSTTGEHTLEAYMREDGLRVDRVLLVTDTNYIPSGLLGRESLPDDYGDGAGWGRAL